MNNRWLKITGRKSALQNVLTLFLLTCLCGALPALLPAADTRANPLLASYCDGSTLAVYPYSFVTRTDGSTFACYEALVTPSGEGLRYAFEDGGGDSDYNDVIVDLWLSGQGTGQPVAHVRFVSKEASFQHWLHLVLGSQDMLVFKAEETTPGTVFDIPLPEKPCPDFFLQAMPATAVVVAGQRTEYSITIGPLNGFSAPVTLSISALPAGISAEFAANPLTPPAETKLRVATAATAPVGVQVLTITGKGGGASQAINVTLEILALAVKLAKEVDKANTRPGEELAYTLRVVNMMQVPLTAIELKDELAEQLEFLDQHSHLRFLRQNHLLTWNGTIPANQEEVIALRVRVGSDCLVGVSLCNEAALKAREIPRHLASNRVCTTVTFQPVESTAIQWTKRADIPQAEVGRLISFRLLLNNRADSWLLSPRIEDFLPQGFHYVPGSSTLDGRPVADPSGSGRLSWNIPQVAAGAQISLRYQVVIGADARRGRNVNRALFIARDQSGQDINREAREFVQVGGAGFVFQSGVQGTVFLDRDGNGFLTAADTPLAGIEVRLSTGQEAVSDSQGRFAFEALFAGEYVVGLNRATLPEKYRAVELFPQVVNLAEGMTETVDFALKFAGEDEVNNARLAGRVFFDKNQNGVFDGGDVLCAEFQAKFDGRQLTRGSAGGFVFSHLLPGSHLLEIISHGDSRTERKEITLKKGDNRLDIPLRFSGIRITVKGEK